jgi:uncharacterized protein YegL
MFGHHSNSNSKTVARSVPLVKDNSGASAVSFDKIEQSGGIDLRKKSEAVTISLQKRNIGGLRAQVVVILDHSGSMYGDYANHKVQDLVERFLGFGLAVDIDGTVPVIPFDSVVHNATEVTLENYHNVVQDKIWKPSGMGSTNLTDALKKVRDITASTDAPIFCAIVTDGEPNDDNSATELVCDLARYPVFIKFLAVQKVYYLEKLDDLPSSERLVDNVDTKEYVGNMSSVTDEQFADDLTDEWQSWVDAAKQVGILT